MKEKLTVNITGVNVEAGIDRETGEIDLFNNHLKLNIRDNLANLVEIENNQEISICDGYRRNENWYFEELDIIRKNKDPYLAVIQLMSEIFQR